MPPSAKRASRARREPRKAATSNADTSPGDVEDSSPSRPAKRPDIDLPEQVQEDEDPPAPNDDQLVSQITQHLRSQEVQASKDHANVIHEAKGDGVKAYAKVAAQDWTFYITKLNVNIGRAPETSHSSQTLGSDEDESYIHIDLGPSKMVSREHATISFDSKDEKWFLHVKGRNGAKVDSQPVKAGQAHPLTSGEVIEIGNVEMMFVLPSEITPLTVHPIYLQRAGVSVHTPQSRTSRRQPLIAPAPPEYKRPGTPPSAQSTAKSPAASTPAVMVGTNGVDLSQDENQHIKPQYSYAQMITQAILNAPDGKLNLNGIYTYIMNTYAYYRHQQAAGWQNSIRHNLSLNKSFDKVARLTDEPGKGMKWQIVPEAREEMIKNAYRVGRGGHRGSSAPSSPNQLAYITHGPRDMASREPPSARRRRASPPASPQPPGSSLLIPQSTPDRSFGRNATMMIDGSPLPRPRKTPARDSSFSVYNPQSPTLTSSYQEDGGSFVTPAPPRMHPKLAPPSTAQRPSQHMPTSSPAPFWKYADIGSTPLKPLGGYDVSPTKAGGVLPPQSSSPPRGDKSPLSSPSRPQKSSPQPIAQPAEAEEEHGFDLTKGFQSIGAYHAPVGGGASILQGRT
ncbi:fork head like 1 [Fusarium tjaetaba]|uniref:Fork head like 1 n=1 Tax=Fusarium tjaetaba TaxID=1567544 RepID=A0A8H5QMY7_9HYPO|nr:fork head like 1 [Fusarium tjaetaba]KAF5618144.1 fork head like 1 [Fusarium tjaetaba]